jgi:archaeal type IV pilus assembly protein PilA
MNFRKINKLRRDVRAISPVIATLLMIAIAVVASLVTYAWVMGYMNFTTEKTGKAIQIQSVSYSGTAGASGVDTFTIYVQNVGDSDVKFAGIGASGTGVAYVNQASATVSSITVGGVSTTSLPQQNTAIVTVTVPGGTTSGVTSVTFKVTTTDGTFSQNTQQFTLVA